MNGRTKALLGITAIALAFAGYSAVDHWGRSGSAAPKRMGYEIAVAENNTPPDHGDTTASDSLPYGNIPCGQHSRAWLVPEAQACVSFNIPKDQYRAKVALARSGNINAMRDLHIYYMEPVKIYPAFQAVEHEDLSAHWALMSALSGDKEAQGPATWRIIETTKKMNDRDPRKLAMLRNVAIIRENSGVETDWTGEQLATEIKRLEALKKKSAVQNQP